MSCSLLFAEKIAENHQSRAGFGLSGPTMWRSMMAAAEAECLIVRKFHHNLLAAAQLISAGAFAHRRSNRPVAPTLPGPLIAAQSRILHIHIYNPLLRRSGKCQHRSLVPSRISRGVKNYEPSGVLGLVAQSQHFVRSK